MTRSDLKRAPTALRLARAAGAGLAIALAGGALAWIGCSGWDPSHPFERNAPEVDKAIGEMDAGQIESAAEALERYLGTGACGDAGIGLPDTIRQKPNGAFDLGLVLFSLAERYGRRFGDEELGDAGADDPQAAQRSAEIDCALTIVKAIASDATVPAELRARARYLAGNLEFLRKKYEEAVKYYDQALELVPGLYVEAGGDGVGRDAAWNRAIALLRLQEQKDAEPPDAQPDADQDAEPDAGDAGNDAPDSAPDSGDDGGQDAGDDGGQDGGDQKPDAGQDAGGDAGQDAGDDGGQDAGEKDASSEPQPQNQPQPPPSATPQQDERMLDQLEEAPTYQEQEAKTRAGVRRGRALEDK